MRVVSMKPRRLLVEGVSSSVAQERRADRVGVGRGWVYVVLCQVRTSWAWRGIKRLPGGGYMLAFKTPEGPKRLRAKVAVCTAPAHKLDGVEGLRVRTWWVLVALPIPRGLPDARRHSLFRPTLGSAFLVAAGRFRIVWRRRSLWREWLELGLGAYSRDGTFE